MSANSTKPHAVRIPVPFGEIAGNWYGSRNVRPILLIHGYSDNCGTFDRLIPLLPIEGSYLAIDLPGHGLSSRIPSGMMYHLSDINLVIMWIMKRYMWPKVSLVGHSLGAIMCYMFAGMHPDKVDLFVALDALQPSYPWNILEQQALFFERFMEADERYAGNVPPTEYTYEDLIGKIQSNPTYKIPKALCHHMLERSITESETLPGRFFFHQDSRTKYPFILGWSLETNAQTAKDAKFPALIVKARESEFYWDEEEFGRLMGMMKKNNHHTRLVSVEGGHYVHLINPERVARVIGDFLGDCGYFTNIINSKL